MLSRPAGLTFRYKILRRFPLRGADSFDQIENVVAAAADENSGQDAAEEGDGGLQPHHGKDIHLIGGGHQHAHDDGDDHLPLDFALHKKLLDICDKALNDNRQKKNTEKIH